MATGPALRRRQLGAALTRLREASGHGRPDAAAQLGCTQAKIGHMESGRNAVGKAELRVLLGFYGAASELATLEAIREDSARRGWWSTYRLPSWLSAYVGLENDAVAMYSFDGEAIPGLLQTPDYDRATHEAVSSRSTPVDVDRRIAARSRRADRLVVQPVLRLHAVISEAAIRRALGLGATGTGQLTHLIAMGARDNVHVQIVPESMGLHASLGGSFRVLDFGGAQVAPPAAYREYAAGGHLVIDDPAIVRDLTAAWDRLHETALDEARSADWLRQVLDEHEPKEADDG